MQSPVIYISLALAVGVAVGVMIQNGFETPDLTVTTSINNTATMAGDGNSADEFDSARFVADIAELERLLQYEINARQELEKKFELLSQKGANFDSGSQSFLETESTESVSSDGESDVSTADRGWFNEQALIDSGMGSSQASELKGHFEQLEMERLYLRDRSIRESWSREKYREAVQSLDSKEGELENQLGESMYDSYLYASGRPNRVSVTSVFPSAQAGIAGIVSGDHIIRYDNQRIYNGFGLREATTGGNAGDTVALEVERDGKTIQFYLVRGPLGIRMNSVSVAP
jgi:hypothetical protein